MYFSVQVSPTFPQSSQSLVNKNGLRVFYGNRGIVCLIVTSEMIFDSGGVCCYMGSENKTKRL